MTLLQQERRNVIKDFLNKIKPVIYTYNRQKISINSFYDNASPSVLKNHYDSVQMLLEDEYIFDINKDFKKLFRVGIKKKFKYEEENYQIIRPYKDGFVIIIGYLSTRGKHIYLCPMGVTYFVNNAEYSYRWREWKKYFNFFVPNNFIGLPFNRSDYDPLYLTKNKNLEKRSLNFIASLDKFKYIDLLKLSKISFYKLLQLSNERLYQIELLIKAGMTRLATAAAQGWPISYEDIKRCNPNYENITYNELNSRAADLRDREREKAQRITIEKLNKKLKKEYKEFIVGGFILKTPKSKQELDVEGKELNHCVTRYDRRIYNNQTKIFFLRTTSDPEKPFYTVEIKNGVLEQVRTVNNQTNDDITNIVRNISKEMGLLHE